MSLIGNLKRQPALSASQAGQVNKVKELILSQLIDRSTRRQARYALLCPSCGTEWDSTPAPTGTGSREAAALEALDRFGFCPLCGDVVCTDCMVTVGELHMCRICAARMKFYERIFFGLQEQKPEAACRSR